MTDLITAARAALDALKSPRDGGLRYSIDVLTEALAKAEAQPGAEYKRGYEEALNDCIRNGVHWARSMFASDAEHIKSAAEAQPAKKDELTAAAESIGVRLKWAQPAEPVAWVTPMAYGSQVTLYKPLKPLGWDDSDERGEWYCTPLYTSPASSPKVPQPLSDYSIENLWLMRTDIHDGDLLLQLRDFARAIERAHGIGVA